METLVNRVVEQGLPTYLLDEIDLLVFPRHTDGKRYVGQVVELVDESTFREYRDDREDGRYGVIRKDETTVYWNAVIDRTPQGSFEFAYDHPKLGDDERNVHTRVFDRIGTLTDRPVDDVEAEFHRKHHYVRYLEREGITDGEELFAFLADLATEEAATVERIRRRRDVDGPEPNPTVPTDVRDVPEDGPFDESRDRLPDVSENRTVDEELTDGGGGPEGGSDGD